MYKVFINDKPIIISDVIQNDNNYPVLAFSELVIDEAIYKLTNDNYDGINLLTTNLNDSWKIVSRKFPVVSAAGGLVLNTDNEILFIKRFNVWDLPKGKIEKNEQKEEAAIREVEEECGITGLKIEQFLLTTYHFYKMSGKMKIKETFWYLMKTNYSGELIPQLEEGITQVCFKNKSEAQEALQDTYTNIKLVYNEYLNN